MNEITKILSLSILTMSKNYICLSIYIYISISMSVCLSIFVKDSMSKRKKMSFLFISLPSLSNEL